MCNKVKSELHFAVTNTKKSSHLQSKYKTSKRKGQSPTLQQGYQMSDIQWIKLLT